VGTVQKIYEKAVKGYIFQLDSNSANKIVIPKDDKLSLAIIQPFLVFQIMLPVGKSFTLELAISDSCKVVFHFLYEFVINF
jgi:hypothetical protein